MPPLLIGLAIGALLFGLCALLRWAPPGAFGKLLLAAWFLLSGAWGGSRWAEMRSFSTAVTRATTSAKLTAVADQLLPSGPSAPDKITQPMSDQIISQAAQTAVGRIASPADLSSIQGALRGAAAARRLSDENGYVRRDRLRRYLCYEVPELMQANLISIAQNRRTSIFSCAVILLMLGIVIGAASRRLGRRAADD